MIGKSCSCNGGERSCEEGCVENTKKRLMKIYEEKETTGFVVLGHSKGEDTRTVRLCRRSTFVL